MEFLISKSNELCMCCENSLITRVTANHAVTAQLQHIVESSSDRSWGHLPAHPAQQTLLRPSFPSNEPLHTTGHIHADGADDQHSS